MTKAEKIEKFKELITKYQYLHTIKSSFIESPVLEHHNSLVNDTAKMFKLIADILED